MRENYDELLDDWRDQLEYVNQNMYNLEREITIAMINLSFSGYKKID